MSAPRQVLFNTLERAISADLNRVGGLAGKAVLDREISLQAGMNAGFETAVARGLGASLGAGLSVNILPGEAFGFDAGAGADQSQATLGVLAASSLVTLDPADPTNPRVDLIYALVSSANQDVTAVEVLVLPGQTISSQNLPKTQQPVLTIAKVTGVAGVTPAYPAVPANGIPLWFVSVPATAVSLNPSIHLLDARKQHNPFGLRERHGVESGFVLSRNTTTQLRLSAGVAWVEGQRIETTLESLIASTGMLPPATALAASTHYRVYLVAPSPSSPVADNGFEICLSAVSQLESGRPTTSVTYRPNRNLSTLQGTTQAALYLGSVWTDASAQFTENPGQRISQDGEHTNMLVSTQPSEFGLVGSPNCWLRPPIMSWLSNASVRLPASFGFIRGVPISVPQIDISIASDLVSGDVEAPSTFFYCYIRLAVVSTPWGLSRQVVGRISSEAPNADGTKPTPEAGFASQDYLFCGSVYNGGTSHFLDFVREEGFVHFVNDLGVGSVGAVATEPTHSTMTGFIFPSLIGQPRLVTARIVGVGTASGAGVREFNINLYVVGETAPWARARFYLNSSGATDGVGVNLNSPVVVNASGQAELSYEEFSGATSVGINYYQTGHAERI